MRHERRDAACGVGRVGDRYTDIGGNSFSFQKLNRENFLRGMRICYPVFLYTREANRSLLTPYRVSDNRLVWQDKGDTTCHIILSVLSQ